MTQMTIEQVEAQLRGSGATLTAVAPEEEVLEDLQTADGRWTISPARNVGRQENMVTLYRTDTAEAVPTDVNGAPMRLRKRYPTTGDFAATYPQLAGRNAFSLGVKGPDGRIVAPEPILKHDAIGEVCWLNPQSSRFEYTRSLGIRSICRSTALWLPINLREHVQMKHNGVWPLIDEDRTRREREEERAQRMSSDDRITQLVELILAQRGIDASQAPEIAQAVSVQVTMTCEECGEEFTAATKQVASMNRARHMKTHGQ